LGYDYLRAYFSIEKGNEFYGANPYSQPSQYAGYNIFEFVSDVHVDTNNYGFYYYTTSSKHGTTTHRFYASPVLASAAYSGEQVTFWAASTSAPPSCESNCIGVRVLSTSYYDRAVADSQNKYGFQSSPGYILIWLVSDLDKEKATNQRNAAICFGSLVLFMMLVVICYLVMYYINVEKKNDDPTEETALVR